MRLARRLGVCLALTTALVGLGAGAVLAGNYAEVTMIDVGEPPTVGEEREIRFSLMQHGITPVESGTVTLTAWQPGSDERLEVEATHSGGGEWTATVTFPADGEWQWRVTHSIFETPPASTIAIAPASAVALAPMAIAALVTVAVAIGVLLAGLRLRRPARPATARADVPAG